MTQSDLAKSARAKWAFTTRRVNRNDAAQLLEGFDEAVPGDLLRVEVVEIGQHSGLQLINGRRAAIYPGDELVLCLGARYAPDQFESEAIIDGGYCHLVAAGGVAGAVTRKHGRMKSPTLLKVLGRVADASGAPVNIRRYALDAIEPGPRPPVIAVFGASMNAGKTTAAAGLIHGLTKAGYKVGACKATGTGACGDVNTYWDAGAHDVLDFTDAGHVTTFGASLDEVREVAFNLVDHLARRGATAIVMEIADGVLQRETAALMNDPSFVRMADATLFAASDALSAVNGVGVLENAGHKVLGVSGVLTRSPLASEEASSLIASPIISRQSLCDGETMATMFEKNGLASPDLQMPQPIDQNPVDQGPADRNKERLAAA